MKSFCLTLFSVALIIGLGSCEKHSWEDRKDADGNIIEKGTKRLFVEHHGEHDKGAKHGDDHKKGDNKGH